MRKRGFVVSILALVLLAASPAFATSLGEVRLKYTGVGPARSATLYVNGQWVTNTLAGSLNLRLDTNYSGNWGAGQDVVDMSDNGQIAVFCTDIYQYAQGSYKVYNVVEPVDAMLGITAQKSADLGRLYDNNYSDLSSSTQMAAFQLAMWEIINETSGIYNIIDPNSGFYATANTLVLTTAQSWLNTLGSALPQTDLWVLSHTSAQDYAIIAKPREVPEPLTLFSGFMAVACLGLYLRKTRKPQPALA